MVSFKDIADHLRNPQSWIAFALGLILGAGGILSLQKALGLELFSKGAKLDLTEVSDRYMLKSDVIQRYILRDDVEAHYIKRDVVESEIANLKKQIYDRRIRKYTSRLLVGQPLAFPQYDIKVIFHGGMGDGLRPGSLMLEIVDGKSSDTVDDADRRFCHVFRRNECIITIRLIDYLISQSDSWALFEIEEEKA